MKNIQTTLGLAALTILLTPFFTHAAGIIEFKWTNVENYTDLEGNGSSTSSFKQFSKEIEGYISKLGKRYLEDGYTLNLEITDVDLTGELEPWHTSPYDDVRVVRSIYPPRLKFNFTLTNELGEVVKKGHERLVDMNFEAHFARRTLSDDNYLYEKIMLSDWLIGALRSQQSR